MQDFQFVMYEIFHFYVLDILIFMCGISNFLWQDFKFFCAGFFYFDVRDFLFFMAGSPIFYAQDL